MADNMLKLNIDPPFISKSLSWIEAILVIEKIIFLLKYARPFVSHQQNVNVTQDTFELSDKT